MKPERACIHLYPFFKILLGFISVILFIVFIPDSVLTADDNAFTIEERKMVLTKTGELLAKNYVAPSVGEACKIILEDESVTTELLENAHPRSFIKELNLRLKSVHNDQHVRVIFLSPEEQRLDQTQPAVSLLLRTTEKQSKNFGFEQVEVQSDNVGYLKLSSFPPADLARGTLLNTLDFLQFCDALIIDLRENRGGSLDMVKLLAGFFFPDSTLFSSYYWRRGDYIENYWTVPDSSRPNYWDIPVYILLSSKTFSAAEDFAFGMQSRKRATLIGEQTGGGANPGFTYSLNHRFNIFIPTGRAINPLNGENWEGSGVEPDIRTSATNALGIGVEQARIAARSLRIDRTDVSVSEYRSFESLLESGKSDTIGFASLVRNKIDLLMRKKLLDEWTINRLGYHYLVRKDYSIARELLQYNVKCFPESVNALDSMGEYYYKTKDYELAIEYYESVIMSDPKHQNARFMLQKIKSEL